MRTTSAFFSAFSARNCPVDRHRTSRTRPKDPVPAHQLISLLVLETITTTGVSKPKAMHAHDVSSQLAVLTRVLYPLLAVQAVLIPNWVVPSPAAHADAHFSATGEVNLAGDGL